MNPYKSKVVEGLQHCLPGMLKRDIPTWKSLHCTTVTGTIPPPPLSGPFVPFPFSLRSFAETLFKWPWWYRLNASLSYSLNRLILIDQLNVSSFFLHKRERIKGRGRILDKINKMLLYYIFGVMNCFYVCVCFFLKLGRLW